MTQDPPPDPILVETSIVDGRACDSSPPRSTMGMLGLVACVARLLQDHGHAYECARRTIEGLCQLPGSAPGPFPNNSAPILDLSGTFWTTIA